MYSASRVFWGQRVQKIVLLLGPSGVGKTKTYEQIAGQFSDWSMLHLDGLASRWGLRHKWIDRECVSRLRAFCGNDDLFLAVSMQAIADHAAHHQHLHILVDVGAGFQAAPLASQLPRLYTCIALLCSPDVAYGRISGRPEGYKGTRAGYEADEFNARRQRVYRASHHTINTDRLTLDEAAAELARILRGMP